MNTDPKARQRAAIILQVRAGQLTVTQAAQQLGISRKTYYQWERRALEGMMEGLSEQPPGRPSHKDDPEKERLQRRLDQVEKELEEARKISHLREILDNLKIAPPKKKNPSSGK